MKPISWSRVCVYALIYFVTGVAASAATSYFFSRFGPSVGQPMAIAGWAASMIVAALVSFAFAARRPAQPYLHAALAYILCELLALTFSSFLPGASGSLAVRALEYATILVAILVGTALGLWLHRARSGSSAESFAGGT